MFQCWQVTEYDSYTESSLPTQVECENELPTKLLYGAVRRGWNERIRSISQLGQIDVVVRSWLRQVSRFQSTVQSIQRSNVQTLTHSCFYIPQKFLNERQVASTKRSKKNNRTTEAIPVPCQLCHDPSLDHLLKLLLFSAVPFSVPSTRVAPGPLAQCARE